MDQLRNPAIDRFLGVIDLEDPQHADRYRQQRHQGHQRRVGQSRGPDLAAVLPEESEHQSPEVGEFLECGQRLGIRMGVDTVAEGGRDIRLDLLETRGLRHGVTVLGLRWSRQLSIPPGKEWRLPAQLIRMRALVLEGLSEQGRESRAEFVVRRCVSGEPAGFRPVTSKPRSLCGRRPDKNDRSR